MIDVRRHNAVFGPTCMAAVCEAGNSLGSSRPTRYPLLIGEDLVL